MTDLVAFPPTDAEVLAGKRTRHLGINSPGDELELPPATSGPLSGGGYCHRQDTLADRWYIAHGLGLLPTVTVQNTAGAEQIAVVEYLNETEVLLIFSEPTEGFAYLSKVN